MAYVKIIVPIATAIVAAGLGLALLFMKKKTWFHKTILFATPWVILLQVGTLLLVATETADSHLLGGRLVFVSLCFLTPLCTKLALLWGESEEKQTLKKFRLLLIVQWVVSLGFAALVPGDRFLLSTRDAVIAFDRWGQVFLIYLVLSSALILALFEKRLALFRGEKRLRIPTIIFMGIFVFFIIEASQGLLIRTLNANLLLLVSLSVLLGYVTPYLFKLRGSMISGGILENRQTIYSSVMILLVGGYLILIGLVGKLIAMVGGDVQSFFSVVIAGAALFIFFMIMTSFSLRERIRRFIDRTIYKGRHDYRTIWSQFSDEIAFKVDLDELTDSILNMITDILQVESGALFLSNRHSARLSLIKKKI